MSFELTPIQLITICAVLNGLVFSILLFEKQENKQANRFLSMLILSMCLTFTPYMLDPDIWHIYRWLAWMPFSLTYWIGPAFYFYVRTLTQPNKAFRKNDWWHFSLIVLNYIHSIYHGIVANSNPWPWFHHVAEFFESLAIVSILIYMFVSFWSIQKYQYALLDRVSSLEQIDLQWLKKIIYVIAGSFALILTFLIVSTGFFGMESFDEWDDSREATLLLYAAILYWLSISGYKQAQTLVITHAEVDEPIANNTDSLMHKIQQEVEERKLYIKQDLSLLDLSRTIDISERAISSAINSELNKNYFQFINEYRVEEMKRLLLDPSAEHLKILSLATAAGFNSKASMNRIFKAYTGTTPKEFREKNR